MGDEASTSAPTASTSTLAAGDGDARRGRCPNKTFFSYDSLRFEKERLETFIDWPLAWMKPEDLAKDGLYYLRTKDHCACVFCRGIVGSWEQGDSPREEHLRHFPHCPFIQGRPVGNIPLAHGNIILGITPSPVLTPSARSYPPWRRVLPSSRAARHRPPESTYPGLGLPPHTGPKRKDFLLLENRAESFKSWPERVKQTPKELAEAGFFYCGLSDHVRCFYCDNGLRNWEKEDDPWEEHARRYPECNFVLLKKGQEFIDRVRPQPPPSKAGPLSEMELDLLMELDIIKATLGMGFPANEVRQALRRRLELTGLPFFNIKNCIETVLQYMESGVAFEAGAEMQSAHESSSSLTPTSTGDETSSSGSEKPVAESSPVIIGLFRAEHKDVPKKGLDLEDARVCKVCMDAELDVLFLPCTHMVTCSSCALALTQCPICREDIKYAIKPILS